MTMAMERVWRPTTEIHWQTSVRRFAHHRGWKLIPSATARWVTFARALPSGDRRIIFAELLGEHTDLSQSENDRLEELLAVAAMCRGHVEVFVWRPHDRKQVMEVLR